MFDDFVFLVAWFPANCHFGVSICEVGSSERTSDSIGYRRNNVSVANRGDNMAASCVSNRRHNRVKSGVSVHGMSWVSSDTSMVDNSRISLRLSISFTLHNMLNSVVLGDVFGSKGTIRLSSVVAGVVVAGDFVGYRSNSLVSNGGAGSCVGHRGD